MMNFIVAALVVALAVCLNIISKQRLKINKMKYAVPEIPDVLMQQETKENEVGIRRIEQVHF